MNPKCPYCGAEMAYMPQSRTVFHDFERTSKHIRYNGSYWCEHCAVHAPEGGWEDTREAAKESAKAAALRRYVEPNRVLTPEELQSMEGEPVFIQQGDGDEYWSVVEGGSLLIGECDPDFQDMTCSFDKDGHFGLHVLGWRALERRPTDAERSAAKWGDAE
jgi:hypothetical protein